MKKSILMAFVAFWAFSAQSVIAQPGKRGDRKADKRNDRKADKRDHRKADKRDHRKADKRDHRKADKREHRKPVKPKRAAVVDRFGPHQGAAGTVVTIRGTSLGQVTKVVFGKREITPDRVGPRKIVFTVPDVRRMGPRKIAVRTPFRDMDVGRFVVALGGSGAPTPDTQPAPDTRPPLGTQPPRPRGKRGPRKRMHRDRTTVSSYFPRHGEPGTQVVIKGRNFSPDVVLEFNGKIVQPTQVTQRKIEFKVPRRTGDGSIRLRPANSRRAIVVGSFDVTRKFDPMAGQKLRDQRRKKAEQRWKTRRAKQAKGAVERRAALEKHERQMRENRAERRKKRAEANLAKWQRRFIASPQVVAEMSLHSERVARLQRMLRLAEVDDRGKLIVRIEIALERENERHQRRMATLKTSFDTP